MLLSFVEMLLDVHAGSVGIDAESVGGGVAAAAAVAADADAADADAAGVADGCCRGAGGYTIGNFD